jgi:uncharacterized membrane protein YadS
MAQNVLIGPFALVITQIYIQKCSPGVLWAKFPKFVIGFLVVAIITTFLPISIRAATVSNSFVASEFFSNISFVLLGMEVNLLDLRSQFGGQGRAMIMYCMGQSLDLCTTLAVSYIMFTVIGS